MKNWFMGIKIKKLNKGLLMVMYGSISLFDTIKSFTDKLLL